jgi:hypothetical protein
MSIPTLFSREGDKKDAADSRNEDHKLFLKMCSSDTYLPPDARKRAKEMLDQRKE